jgi:hypothetical protein
MSIQTKLTKEVTVTTPKKVNPKIEVSNASVNINPKITIPYEIFRDHLIMAKNADTEYSTAMKIEDKGNYQYEVKDWFFLKQECSMASAVWLKEGVIDLVKHAEGDLKDWFGVFHIHPKGMSAKMSSTDENTMWNWLKNSSRGIFLVSNEQGEYECILLTKVGDFKMQIPMSINVPLTDAAHEDTLKELLKNNIVHPVYTPPTYAPMNGFGYGISKTSPEIPDKKKKNKNKGKKNAEPATLDTEDPCVGCIATSCLGCNIYEADLDNERKNIDSDLYWQDFEGDYRY